VIWTRLVEKGCAAFAPLSPTATKARDVMNKEPAWPDHIVKLMETAREDWSVKTPSVSPALTTQTAMMTRHAVKV
jgi:hypothetical protein